MDKSLNKKERDWQRGKVATKIKKIDDVIKVYYHDTPIVQIHTDGNIILDNGGYETSTTKRRMNQVSELYNLNFKVWQHNYEWYVENTNGNVQQFKSNRLKLKR